MFDICHSLWREVLHFLCNPFLTHITEGKLLLKPQIHQDTSFCHPCQSFVPSHSSSFCLRIAVFKSNIKTNTLRSKILLTNILWCGLGSWLSYPINPCEISKRTTCAKMYGPKFKTWKPFKEQYVQALNCFKRWKVIAKPLSQWVAFTSPLLYCRLFIFALASRHTDLLYIHRLSPQVVGHKTLL